MLDTAVRQFDRMLSVDSHKAIKAQEFGWLNGINYMAPADVAGVGNLCPHAGDCKKLCLGLYSGQAAMVPKGQEDTGLNPVRESRIAKARLFMTNRRAFMSQLAVHTAKLTAQAYRVGFEPCVRPNGSTDIAFEGIPLEVSEDLARRINKILGHAAVQAGKFSNIMEAFPWVSFTDYTKNPHRMRRKLPGNYHLTFSRDERNEAESIKLLHERKNVAVVFRHSLPESWHGFPVINGDIHDLRHLDPKGVVVGLLPKGQRAKKDRSGFVVG